MCENTSQESNGITGDFFSTVLGSPRHVVAPMVDQSELAWRMLCRKFDAHLCFTPMWHAGIFVRDVHYRKEAMQSCEEDRPLIVQFCANDPDTFVAAGKLAQDYCDAIDLNLGCPQNIARRGRYGAFLQEHWDLIEKIVQKASQELSIPVTVKIRVFQSIEKTVSYAKMLEKAGAKMLTVHGRTRDQKGPFTGLASWDHIKAVKESVSIPVLANGNIQYLRDVDACIRHTGVDGVMAAEGSLHNPAIFSGRQPPTWEMSEQYLDFVEKYPCPLSYARGHMFKMWHQTLVKYPDMRDKLGKLRSFQELREVCNSLGDLCKRDRDADVANGTDSEEPGRLPYWRCQPYVRPPPKQTLKRPLEEANENQVRFDTPDTKRLLQQQQKKRHKEIQKANGKELRAGRYPPCESCQMNAKSQKCVHQFCRQCCKEKSKQDILDCEAHKFKFFTYRKGKDATNSPPASKPDSITVLKNSVDAQA